MVDMARVGRAVLAGGMSISISQNVCLVINERSSCHAGVKGGTHSTLLGLQECCEPETDWRELMQVPQVGLRDIKRELHILRATIFVLLNNICILCIYIYISMYITYLFLASNISPIYLPTDLSI